MSPPSGVHADLCLLFFLARSLVLHHVDGLRAHFLAWFKAAAIAYDYRFAFPEARDNFRVDGGLQAHGYRPILHLAAGSYDINRGLIALMADRLQRHRQHVV